MDTKQPKNFIDKLNDYQESLTKISGQLDPLHNNVVSKKKMTYIGGVSASVLYLIILPLGLGLSRDSTEYKIIGVSVAIVGLVISIFLIRKIIVLSRKEKHFRAYIDIILSEGETSITAIAEAAGVERRIAITEIQEMIDYGYFNGHINRKTQRIVPHTSRSNDSQQGVAGMVTMKCGGCGAKIKLPKNGTVKCEYCGTVIRDE